MGTTSFADIENQIDQLSLSELQALARRVRRKIETFSSPNGDLAAMAGDPQIQAEIRSIDVEFRHTEEDGLDP